ncbi:putative flippase GtrA [Acetoanaerobium pronyense]|uniref:Flippase GtrA n=1 Tax=Acetoanaerobium pronyense TaxID=1482736 RepID=A0ABS4KKQ3_9FIRM|nr:GtrA family protein [Acetoanaerobium pronyense]MBP2028329.1 putative flippase GtrA [Acetoanaerobium pronyense]
MKLEKADLKSFILNDENKRFLKFAIVGVSNTAISFLVYVVLVKLSIYYILASIISYIAGILNSYILNTAFVFKEKKTKKNLFMFSSVYLSALLINLSLLYIMVDVLGVGPITGQILVTGLVMIYNYIMQKKWTFGSSK